MIARIKLELVEREESEFADDSFSDMECATVLVISGWFLVLVIFLREPDH